jgi:pseudouridine synthase
VFPVGRLDFDTTGLLLVTDDGDLAFALTHPSRGVDKEYEAHIAKPLATDAIAALRRGIVLEDGPTAPCEVSQQDGPDGTLVRLVLHQGRKRQVRRMLAAVGAPVLALHRVRFGPLRLGDLAPGAVRAATAAEHAMLLHAAGLATPRPGRAG